MSGHAGDTFHYHLFGDERYGHRHPFLHINHDHEPVRRCLAHGKAEPCPVCAAYIAGGQ